MKKQTAVEWLWLNLTDDLIGELSPEQIKSIYQLILQAKAMEKEQIVDALNIGYHQAFDIQYENAEQYYNETYGGGEE